MNNVITTILCVVGLGVGVYTFAKHLNAFNNLKTSAIDAWLVAVGVMGWSLVLHGGITDNDISEMVGYVFWLIYWVGDNLKIQHHCIRYRRKLRKMR